MTTEEILRDAEAAAKAEGSELTKGQRHHLRRWKANQAAVTDAHRAYARTLLNRPEVLAEVASLRRANP